MCGPMAVAVASLVATSASAYQASSARKQAGEYEAAVARNNAKVAEWKASDAQDRATTSAMNIGRQVNDMRGKQSAALAANGLDLSSGSPQAVLERTNYYGLEDQRTTLENGNNESWGFKQQASNYRSQAQWSKSAADAENPWMSAGFAALGQAGNVADKWGKGGGDSGGSASAPGAGDPRYAVRGSRGY